MPYLSFILTIKDYRHRVLTHDSLSILHDNSARLLSVILKDIWRLMLHSCSEFNDNDFNWRYWVLCRITSNKISNWENLIHYRLINQPSQFYATIWDHHSAIRLHPHPGNGHDNSNVCSLHHTLGLNITLVTSPVVYWWINDCWIKFRCLSSPKFVFLSIGYAHSPKLRTCYTNTRLTLRNQKLLG